MAVTTLTLESVQHALEVAGALSGCWFRGHEKAFGSLTPGVFRPPLIESFQLPNSIPDPSKVVEKSFVDGFQIYAPSVHSRVPPKTDFLTWLFLMQHHGTPTRLLDWTENILVATYFAAYAAPDEDGEVWAMAPAKLALSAGLPRLPSLDNIQVQLLAMDAMSDGTPIGLAINHGFEEFPSTPLPIHPPKEFSRMVTQSSTFTIHAKPPTGRSIPDILIESQYLSRYIIPAAKKPDVLHELMGLGINHLTLFPQLDSVGIYLKQEAQRPQWEPQEPPKCGGPWPPRQ